MKNKRKKLRIRKLIRRAWIASSLIAMYGGMLFSEGNGWTAGRIVFAAGCASAFAWMAVTAYVPLRIGGGQINGGPHKN